MTFYLTKERANLAEGKVALKMGDVDFFLRDAECDFEKILELLKNKGSVSLKNGFLNFKAKECLLMSKIAEIGNERAGFARESVAEGAEKDFYTEYAVIRIKSLLKELERDCQGASLTADGEFETVLAENQAVRTAAIIMCAETGLLDGVLEDKTVRFECRMKNPRKDVARLFYEADRQRKSRGEINLNFYRAVLAFLGGSARW